ncbi:uncharacterized protein (TIGR02453 family) [Hoeflea marina]|uniref:Uncharacterized protein (TIGR02453 family) n=1 Tax=Hoeflea marina TaxID=274592 RepID=A0A317PSF6_9HYPH|nr:TIGR02453 family protein [Hoeflea marina]PWW04392.1 uncharacterized protein (TIGR02453 family) [Hoeflea marina]
MNWTTYSGFGEKALPFLKALGFHQDRGWFQENKALYESELQEPLGRLVDDLAERLAADGIPLTCTRRTSVFRINRDVRFAKDKNPYKTHVSAVVTRTGLKSDPGLLYVHVGPDVCRLAAGFYFMEPDEHRAFREAIVRRFDEYKASLAPLEALGLAMDDEDSLKRTPRGFETVVEPELLAHLRRRHLTVSKRFDPERLSGTQLLDDIVELAAAAQPFLNFGWRAVDPVRAARDETTR